MLGPVEGNHGLLLKTSPLTKVGMTSVLILAIPGCDLWQLGCAIPRQLLYLPIMLV